MRRLTHPGFWAVTAVTLFTIACSTTRLVGGGGDASVASVTVTPSPANGQVGSGVQLTAALADSNGQPITGRPITWTSSNTNIAAVNASGWVTGVAVGTAAITATGEGESGPSSVTVSGGPPPPPDVTPPSTPQNLTAVAGGSTQVTPSWSASTDNVGVTGYRVFRNGAQVGAPAGTSFQDGSVAPNTTYSYTVAA